MSLRTILLFICTFAAAPLMAEVVSRDLAYRAGDTEMRGMIAWDDSVEGRRPGVLVVHEWWGHNDYARERAGMLAELGYTAMAVDMYGDGKTADHPDDAGRFAGAVSGDLALAKARFDAALNILRGHPTVRPDDVAAIGYCFGGGIVLNMARMGSDVDGVVSYHGSLGTSRPASAGDIQARILVFNGADDSFVTAEQIAAFKAEMDAAGADYTFINYPGVVHSFTNPDADAVGEKFGLPLAYDAGADRDSWTRTQAFFQEIFRED
jgi:dienelactone hydrolase